MYSLHVVPQYGRMARGRRRGSLFVRATLIAMVAVLCVTVVRPTPAYATTPPPEGSQEESQDDVSGVDNDVSGVDTETNGLDTQQEAVGPESQPEPVELCQPRPEDAPEESRDEPVYGICDNSVIMQDPVVEQTLEFPVLDPGVVPDPDAPEVAVSVDDLEVGQSTLRQNILNATGGNFDVAEESDRANFERDLFRTDEVLRTYNRFPGASTDIEAGTTETTAALSFRFAQTLEQITRRSTECVVRCLVTGATTAAGDPFRYLVVPFIPTAAAGLALYGLSQYTTSVLTLGLGSVVLLAVATYIYAQMDRALVFLREARLREADRVNSAVATEAHVTAAQTSIQLGALQAEMNQRFATQNAAIERLENDNQALREENQAQREENRGMQGTINRFEQFVGERAQQLQNAEGDENESFRSAGTEFAEEPADFDNGEL